MPKGEADTRTGLAVTGVSHAFGSTRVLEGISLRVAAGELVCLVGPSGCGKTTLLRLVAGLEELQRGAIAIDGGVVADAGRVVATERRGVGFMFQDYALFPHLSVRANVGFGLDRVSRATREARIDEVLGQLDLFALAASFPHQLSGGQQQRVALARALAPKPRVMLLDEPFSNLDLSLRERVRDDTLHVLKQSGAATLMVTHDPEEAMFMADRIAVLHAGHIEQHGAPADVYARPASAFVTRFFGQVNAFTGRVAEGRVETPAGVVPAPGFAEGSEVEVLVRPEALRLQPVDGVMTTHPAKVLAARPLGRSSWIHLCLGEEAGRVDEAGHHHVHARVPGAYLPGEGEILDVRLDPSQVFVFPRRNPT
jgi:iron(III) transport system ATP-binding protein